jgi:hypothetical protein
MKRSRKKGEARKKEIQHAVSWSNSSGELPEKVFDRAIDIFETNNVAEGETVTITYKDRDYVFGPPVTGTVRYTEATEDTEVEVAIHTCVLGPAKSPEPYRAWVWFMPRIVREAFVRELLDERDAMRSAGKGRFFIAAALACQIAIFATIGGKEALKSFVRRVIGLEKTPSDVS